MWLSLCVSWLQCDASLEAFSSEVRVGWEVLVLDYVDHLVFHYSGVQETSFNM